jgi:hypothetical protein
VQNCVIRTITRTKKYDYITPVLQRLHWLPVHLRPTYTVLLFTYFALNDMHVFTVPQVLQYLREFDARAMQSCKPLPCGTGS